MKKILLIATLFVASFTTAKAQNAHFLCQFFSITDNNDGSWAVNFKLVGLGNATYTNVTATGNVTFDIACWNYAGHFVRGLSGARETVVSTQGYTSDANGEITGSFDIAPSDAKCRPNVAARMTAILSNVNFSNVTVSAISDGTQISGCE